MNSSNGFYKGLIFTKSLRAKLIILFMLISIIPLIYIGMLFLNESSQSLTDSLIKSGLKTSNKMSSEIKKLMDDHHKKVNEIINNVESGDDEVLLNRLFEDYDSYYIFFESIFLLDQSSEIILKSDDVSDNYLDILNYDELNEKVGKDFYTEIYSFDNSKSLFLFKRVSFKNRDHFLIIELNSSELEKILSANISGNSSIIYILDNTDNFIINFPNSKNENYEKFIVNNIKNYDFGSYIIRQKNKQNNFLAMYVPIVGIAWKIIICQKEEEVYSLVNLLKKHLLYILGITILISFIFAFFISKSIAVPILKVAKGASEISKGNLDVEIKVNTKDEVHELANSFNRMAGNLKGKISELDRKVFELTTVFEISNNMNDVSIDLDNLLDIIIDKSIEAANAQRGSLMLLNTKTDLLELARVRIWDEEEEKTIPIHDFKRNIDIRSGEGIAGSVVHSGKMYVVNNPDEDENFKSYSKGKANVNQLVCVPLKTNNVCFGVINIANKKDGSDFNENDLSLLETLSNQAAVCMDNAKLFKLAITDGLTGLNVVRHFKVRFEEELSRARRYQENLSLLLFDIDHFKSFNDTYGHQKGDEVLIEVAKIMKKVVRDVDIPARYGGEEFCVLLPETDAKGAEMAAERLRKAIEENKIPNEGGEPLTVTVSIGIANFPDHTSDMMEMIRLSDTALYYAKEHGRNNSQVYSDKMGDKSEK